MTRISGQDNFFAYAVNKKNENGGVFISVREAIQALKQDGIDKIVIVPGHWNYDNIDTILTHEAQQWPAHYAQGGYLGRQV